MALKEGYQAKEGQLLIYRSTTPTLVDTECLTFQADVNGNLKVAVYGGGVASGATDSGNPVKVGGKYNATPPTLTDGQRGDLQMDSAGNTKIVNAAKSDKTNDEVTAFPKQRNLTVVSKTTAVTIGGGVASDTILTGLMITAALTGTCVITGFADSDGAAQSITLPALTAAGFKDFGNALNGAGALTITCSNAADDNLVSAIWVAA